MKKKRITYFVLMPCVLIVWGIIVYKISKNSNDYNIHKTQLLQPKMDKKEFEFHSFTLKNDYPDPFFRTIKPGYISNTRKISEIKKEKIIEWPNINFNGFVVNGETVKGHLTINGEDKILQINDSFLDNYRLTAITADSVMISFNNMSKWYNK